LTWQIIELLPRAKVKEEWKKKVIMITLYFSTKPFDDKTILMSGHTIGFGYVENEKISILKTINVRPYLLPCQPSTQTLSIFTKPYRRVKRQIQSVMSFSIIDLPAICLLWKVTLERTLHPSKNTGQFWKLKKKCYILPKQE